MTTPRANRNCRDEPVEVPAMYLCRFSHKLMETPMMTKTGLRFDKDAILQWLDTTGNMCPITLKPFYVSDMVVDRALLYQINVWRSKNCIPDASFDSSSSYHEKVLPPTTSLHKSTSGMKLTLGMFRSKNNKHNNSAPVITLADTTSSTAGFLTELPRLRHAAESRREHLNILLSTAMDDIEDDFYHLQLFKT